jgi:site-specific recombinase XerD
LVHNQSTWGTTKAILPTAVPLRFKILTAVPPRPFGDLAALSGPVVPALVAASGNDAAMRFLDFFATQIENDNTRAAYVRAAREFLAWCDAQQIALLTNIQPVLVAAWIKQLKLTHSVPTVKLRLAAIRHLFDWLVMGHIMQTNPAISVRGPKHVVRKGKTPILDAAEVRTLLDSIGNTTHIDLRDKALIALMLYSFARIGAVVGMAVEDVFVQNRRLWVRLHEKGGKLHDMPCNHNAEAFLHAYIDGTGIAADAKGPLFRTVGRVPRNWHYGVSEAGRFAGERGVDGEPRQHTDDATL